MKERAFTTHGDKGPPYGGVSYGVVDASFLGAPGHTVDPDGDTKNFCR